MEKLRKKKRYYFPYKIFNVEHKSNSQTNIFDRYNLPLNPTNYLNKKTKEVNNFSKKLKSTILSSKIFSKYMDNYIGQTQDFCFKTPGNTIYPLKKNYQFLPITFQKNQSIDETIDDKKQNNDEKISSVIEKPYGFKYKKTKIIINRDNDIYHNNSQERIKSKIFMTFSEGNFYSNELLKKFGLNNIDINNSNEVIKNNFEYLHESIINIYSLENFASTESIEFKIKNHFNNEDIQFNMNIFSLCFKFYEIKEDSDNNNITIKNKYKLYLPFKLLSFFYLLNYSYFKKFISEIIYYDEDTKSMNFNQDKFGQILKKYSFYLRNIYQKNNKDSFNDITFYKNELVYNNYCDWIVINENNKNKGNIIYKMKIIFPKVIFEEKKNKCKVINYINKNILIRALKLNFLDWEKIVLFDLFSNKRFRYLINNILIGGKRYHEKIIKLYEKKFFSSIATDNMAIISDTNKTFNIPNQSNKSYEFFISVISKKQTFYYKFVPNIILIVNGEAKKRFQKINLNLKESRKLFELSKYWGAINTLFKCMYKDEMNNKIFLKLNILDDMPKELYRTIKKENDMRESLHYKNINISSASTVKEKSNYMIYKTNEIELVLSECLLGKLNINFNEAKSIYYKVPNKLLNTILTYNNNMKIVKCIINCYDEIINNKNEIDVLSEERNMNKKIYEHKRGNSPYEKNRFERERHPTVGQNKFIPSKTYNKNKSFFNKNSFSINRNALSKSFGKQKTSYYENRNKFPNKLEKKSSVFGNEFNSPDNKNDNEKLPLISQNNRINKNEGMNENKEFKKIRYSRNYNDNQ